MKTELGAALEGISIAEANYRERGYHLSLEAAPGELLKAARFFDERGFYLAAIVGIEGSCHFCPWGQDIGDDDRGECKKESDNTEKDHRSKFLQAIHRRHSIQDDSSRKAD